MNLTQDPRYAEITELRNRIFALANSFSGEATGVIAGELHQSVNRLSKSLRMMEKGITSEDNSKQLREWFSKQVIPVSPDVIEQVIALTSPKK